MKLPWVYRAVGQRGVREGSLEEAMEKTLYLAVWMTLLWNDSQRGIAAWPGGPSPACPAFWPLPALIEHLLNARS